MLADSAKLSGAVAVMTEAIGWVGTVAFATSYFLRTAAALRRMQALAACLWIGHGVMIASKPVVAANLLVALGAMVSMRRKSGAH